MVYELPGGEKISLGEVAGILFIFVALMAIVFYATNIPELADRARLFWWLGTTGLIWWLVAVVTKAAGFKFIDVVVDSPKILFFEQKGFRRVILFAILIMGLLTFFFMARTGYAIEGPAFQVIEVGDIGRGLLSGLAGIMENILFFGAILGTTFALTFRATKSFGIAFLLTLMFVPLIFLTYHTARYGFTDFVSTFAVFIFGFELTLTTLILRNLWYAHARHFFNNMGRIVFRQMTIGTFFTILVSSIWFWLGIALLLIFIIVFTISKLRRKGG